MRRPLEIVIILCLLTAGCTPKDPTAKSPNLTEMLSKCSRLYTTECQIHKVITYSDDSKTKIYGFEIPNNLVGDRKIAIPMDVTVKAYIDMGTLDSSQIDKQEDKITITLPDPRIEITASRIEHQNIKEYVSGLRFSITEEEKSNFEKQGLADVKNHLPEMQLISKARESAAKQLLPLIEQMGYKKENITFTFRAGVTDEQIGKNDDLRNIIILNQP